MLNIQVPCRLTVLCTWVVLSLYNPYCVRPIEGHYNNTHKGKVRLGFWVVDSDENIEMLTLKQAGNQWSDLAGGKKRFLEAKI